MKDTLDPFRVLVGVLASEKEVDHLVAASNIAGLTVDLSLSERDEGSRIQRIRALQPRILAAYDSLDDEARLVAAQAAIVHLGPQASQLLDRVRTALEAVGWVIQNGTLTPVDLDSERCSFPRDRNGTRLL